MSHIHHEIGPDRVSNFPEARPVEYLRVSREAGNDHFRLMLRSQRCNLVIVDLSRVRVQSILHRVIQLAGKIWRSAMGEMTTGIQAHAKNRVPSRQKCKKHRSVSLGAGMRLNVCIVCTKQGFGTLYRQHFHLIDKLAATVVALAGVPFRVFVGELAALGFHNPGACVVLRCN